MRVSKRARESERADNEWPANQLSITSAIIHTDSLTLSLSLTDSQRSVGGSGAPQQPPTDSRNATLNTALLGHRTSRSIEYIETRHRHGHRTSSYTPNRRCMHDTNDTHASDHTRNDTHASHGKRKAAAPRRRAWSLVLHTKKQRAQRRPREEKREEEEGVTQREHHTEGARVRARGRERVCVCASGERLGGFYLLLLRATRVERRTEADQRAYAEGRRDAKLARRWVKDSNPCPGTSGLISLPAFAFSRFQFFASPLARAPPLLAWWLVVWLLVLRVREMTRSSSNRRWWWRRGEGGR